MWHMKESAYRENCASVTKELNGPPAEHKHPVRSRTAKGLQQRRGVPSSVAPPACQDKRKESELRNGHNGHTDRIIPRTTFSAKDLDAGSFYASSRVHHGHSKSGSWQPSLEGCQQWAKPSASVSSDADELPVEASGGRHSARQVGARDRARTRESTEHDDVENDGKSVAQHAASAVRRVWVPGGRAWAPGLR